MVFFYRTLITWYWDCFILLVANKWYPTCWQLPLLLPLMGTSPGNFPNTLYSDHPSPEILTVCCIWQAVEDDNQKFVLIINTRSRLEGYYLPKISLGTGRSSYWVSLQDQFQDDASQGFEENTQEWTNESSRWLIELSKSDGIWW